MLHLHMLVQLHGFSHPDDIFRRGDLEARIKSAWRFVASICFRSSEAVAHHFHEDSAISALKGTSRVPLNPKQQGMIGPERVKEVMSKQLSARGVVLNSPDAAAQVEPLRLPFPPWMSRSYADPSLSSADFASMMTLDSHAGLCSFGNHTCRSDVCHKGYLGKIGFCRMMFWHWRPVAILKKVGGVVHKAMRFHGTRLQKRWDGLGMPPLEDAPPHEGAAAVERSHCFTMKMHPAIVAGPRCNHDVGPLLRFPVLASKALQGGSDRAADSLPASIDAPKETDGNYDAATQAAIDLIVENLTDHERYCGAYASKEEPHLTGLLQSLSVSVRHLEQEQARQEAAGQDITALQKARLLLHRLQSSTNRRMHKGFPEMLAYIMEKPEYIASMEFVPLYYTQVLISYVCVVEAAASLKLTYSVPDFTKRILRPGQIPFLDHVDYAFRSEQLLSFPLYFFIAACDARGKWQKKATLAWWEPADGNHFHPRSAVRYSSTLTDVPLFAPETMLGIESSYLREYAYYVALRTHKAWRCPELIGHIPPRIHDESTFREKGEFALFVMLLFRPYRCFKTEVLEEAQKKVAKGSPSDADAHWTAIYEFYLTWRRDIDSIAKPLWQNGSSSTLAPGPPTLTAASELSGPLATVSKWWACAIYSKLRNFDLIAKKHTSRNSSVPTTVYGLPVVEEQVQDESEVKESTSDDLTRRNEAPGSDDGEERNEVPGSDAGDQDGAEDDVSNVPHAPRLRGDAARLCGKLPMDPDVFLRSLIPVESRGQTSLGGCVETGLRSFCLWSGLHWTYLLGFEHILDCYRHVFGPNVISMF
jgi:hypothetical protein